MLGNQGKACSGKSQIIGFAGGGTDDVVQFVIDGHDIGIFGQKRRKDFANQAVGMGIGIANAQYGAFLLMEGRNSF